MSSTQSPFRKEWRVVAEQSAQSAGNEEMNRSKLGQTDERTIYEQGREQLDMTDFCSVQMDGVGVGLDNECKQKLHSFSRRREELMQMEIELRAQMIAKSEIMGLRSSFDAQIKEQVSTAAKLKEQLHDREHRISDLERIMEEKERELQEIRLDNEEAWAKEDLLREQNMELANFRREHDNIEAERTNHLKQIHDLQEHIQEKDRQFIELQEQHRTAQDTILYRDKQLKEAQAWITRAQEMDALQSSTNHALQTELRDRTDQYNQLWLGCQRQIAEMERLHVQTIQQLQLELAGSREKNGTSHEVLLNLQSNVTDTLQFGQNNNNGSHLEANGIQNSGNMSNGNSENSKIFASSGNTSAQANHASSVPVTPSLLGVPSYLSHGQVAAMHPSVMNQDGLNQSAMHVPQSQVSHLSTVQPVSSFQHWQGPQAASEVSLQKQYPPSLVQSSRNRSGPEYEYEAAVNELHPGHLGDHMSHGREHDAAPSSTEAVQAHALSENSRLTGLGQETLRQMSSQFQNALQLGSFEQNFEFKESDGISVTNDGFESRSLTTDQSGSIASPSASEAPVSSGIFSESTMNNAPDTVLSEVIISAGETVSVPAGKISDAALLDERSLLACIVRTIPAGGKIRISSTLPNRLGKMLAPLHWHDYRKKYGKLDDFVASHPELFLIDGDHILVREGAQGIIAATAAVAKVAAAAAATSPNSSFFPSVAVTPMAQATNRLKNTSLVEPKPTSNGLGGSSQVPMMRKQHLNGVAYSSVKILSKSKDASNMTGSNQLPGKGHLSS